MSVAKCTFKIFILTMAVSGCVTQGPDNFNIAEIKLPPNSRFWVPPKERSACPSGAPGFYELDFQRTVRGWDDDSVRAPGFIKILGLNASYSLGDSDFDMAGYVQHVVEAAKSSAFTVRDWGSPGGSDPVFPQSLMLINLSYTYSLFDHEKAWSPSQKQTVIDWGNKISSGQYDKHRYATLDSRAAIAAAQMSWGAATSQPDIFQSGLQDFYFVASKMTNGMFRNMRKSGLLYNNEIVQFMILAAEAAERNGIPAYEFSYGGVTLHDAIRWHTERSLVEYGKHYSGRGYVQHMAWAPIYWSRFPDKPAAQSLLKDQPSYWEYWGSSMGGWTKCLWGR